MLESKIGIDVSLLFSEFCWNLQGPWRDSGIYFKSVRLCTINHCTDLMVIKESLGPDCGRLMKARERKFADQTEMRHMVKSI